MARLSAEAVNHALRALKALRLAPEGKAAVEAFLVAKRLAAIGSAATIANVNQIVADHFEVLPGHPRGRLAPFRWQWLVASNSGRKTVWNQTTRSADNQACALFKPRSPGGRGDLRAGLRADAAGRLHDYLDVNARPGRQALAALLLRDSDDLDETADWQGVVQRLCEHLALEENELSAITGDQPLEVSAFREPVWEPRGLSDDLAPSEAAPPEDPPDVAASRYESDDPVDIPAHVEDEVRRVLNALSRYGHRRIVALAGVPGTSKSHVARIAARRHAGDPSRVMEIQFSPGYSYEEFVEGPWLSSGEAQVRPGALLELNRCALDELSAAQAEGRAAFRYVLLVEELTRADLPSVLGELLTYVEYRGEGDQFRTRHDRNNAKRLAPNLAVLATYNPTDRSAVNLDAALARRIHELPFPPRVDLLQEMLEDPHRQLSLEVIDRLTGLFAACAQACADDPRLGDFAVAMPFGHAVFAEVVAEEDLNPLWTGELLPILARPRAPRHPLYDVIADHYRWTDPAFRVPPAEGLDASEGSAGSQEPPADEEPAPS